MCIGDTHFAKPRNFLALGHVYSVYTSRTELSEMECSQHDAANVDPTSGQEHGQSKHGGAE